MIDAQPYQHGLLRTPSADVYDSERRCAQQRAYQFAADAVIEFDAAAQPVVAAARCHRLKDVLVATSLREESAAAAAAEFGWVPLELAAAVPRVVRGGDGAARNVDDGSVLADELQAALEAELRLDDAVAPVLFAGDARRLTSVKRYGAKLYAFSNQRLCPNLAAQHRSRTLYACVELRQTRAHVVLRCLCRCAAPAAAAAEGGGGLPCEQWQRKAAAPLSLALTRRLFPHVAAVHLDERHELLPMCDIKQHLHQQQRGDAEMLAQLYRGRVCYDGTEKRFYAWCGNRWMSDDVGRIELVMSAAACHQYEDAAAQLRRDRKQALRELGEDEAAEALAARFDDDIAACLKRAKSISTYTYIRAVVLFVRPLLAIQVANNECWDAQPWLLFCENAVVDLRRDAAVRSRPAVPQDYNRSVAPVQFRGLDVAAPLFEQALRQTFHYDAVGVAREEAEAVAVVLDEATRDDREAFVERCREIGRSVSCQDVVLCEQAARRFLAAAAAADNDDVGVALVQFASAFGAAVPATPGELELLFFQQAVGASLIGTVWRERIYVHYGRLGANGKTMLFELFARCLGPAVARPIAAETLMAASSSGASAARSGSQASPDLAMLQNLRLVFCSEFEDNGTLSAAVVRKLSGGDTITSRKLYKDCITFVPTHTLHLVTNTLLRTSTHGRDDKALWRRVLVLQYLNRFVAAPRRRANEHAVRPALRQQLWEEEASGVLAWLVRGALRAQSTSPEEPTGPPPPPSALLFSERYERDQRRNVVEQFCAARCRFAAGVRVGAGVLRAAFDEWMATAGANDGAGAAAAPPPSALVFSRSLLALPGVERGQRTNNGNSYVGLALRSADDDDDDDDDDDADIALNEDDGDGDGDDVRQ